MYLNAPCDICIVVYRLQSEDVMECVLRLHDNEPFVSPPKGAVDQYSVECVSVSLPSPFPPGLTFTWWGMLRFMFDINQPSLPTSFFILFLCLFLSLLAFSTVFHP